MCASITNIPYDQFLKLYTVEKAIGSGSYGQVFRIKCHETGKSYAFKKIIIEPEEDPGEVIAEILNYKTMEHELVIKVALNTHLALPVLLQRPQARQGPQRPRNRPHHGAGTHVPGPDDLAAPPKAQPVPGAARTLKFRVSICVAIREAVRDEDQSPGHKAGELHRDAERAPIVQTNGLRDVQNLPAQRRLAPRIGGLVLLHVAAAQAHLQEPQIEGHVQPRQERRLRLRGHPL